MHAYVESRCANNAFEGCTRHLYVLRMHLYVSVHMHSVGSTGGEMYPRRGSWGVRCCFWLWPGTQGIGYRHAWWVCDVSHFSTGLTYLAMHLPVLFFNVYFVLCIKVKRAGTAVDENEGVDLCRVSLVLSKSIHLDPYTLTLDGASQIDSSRRAHDSPCWHCRT